MNKVIIIAEAGVNHNGSIDLAKKLIDIASDAGVDYVKFQTFKAQNLVTKSASKADYQIENTKKESENQYQMLKNLELSHEQHAELIAYCSKKKISFFSTAFDLDSLFYLKELGMPMVKIPSGEITNLPYLLKAAELFSKVIISTGMATIEDIKNALNIFIKAGVKKENINVLHCNTEYPTPMKDVNLKAMLHIKNAFDIEVGYSDHTLGIEVPIAAVALGAKVIEKHFTLDRRYPGPDHLASIEPHELKAMVSGIRNIELAMSGSGIKEPSISEKKNIEIARKSIVAKSFIRKGEVFSDLNITTKRPGNGLSPMLWHQIIGQIAHRDYIEDELIETQK
jgi:N,N'-diacetyllegionaminate synthase